MEPTDLTIKILKGIRDEVKGVREEVRSVRDEVSGLRGEVSGLRGEVNGVRDEVHLTNERVDELRRRQTETEIRLATELVAVGGAVREVRDLLREDRTLRDRVDDHERRLAAVEHRAG